MSVTKPIRVCHVSLTLHTGGLERLLVDFARFHDPELVELEFLALRDGCGQPADDIRALGCKVHQMPSGSLWQRFRWLRQFFTEHGFSLIHTHNTPGLLQATVSARMSPAKALINTRHGQLTYRTLSNRLVWRVLARFNDRIVAVSHDAARLTTDEDRVPARMLETIWNGIDPERFVCRGPEKDGPVTAVTVCRLVAEKDLTVMLKAIELAADRLPQLRLRIVGDGDLMGSLVEEVHRLGITDRVEFLGHRTDVPELLAQSSFYVCSSWTEGLSLTLLEAMAVGLPVVATSAGGNGEVIVDGETGMLVPIRNPEALAEAIVQMGSAPERWEPMGLAGRRRVEACFDVRRMVSDYEGLYRRLLEG